MTAINVQLSDKKIRLVEYLIALTKANAKINRDLNEYHSILWISEIPHEPKHCYTKVWGEEDEQGDDSWIEVRKFPRPLLPKVPEKLQPWVNYDTLNNCYDIPDLYETITIKKEEHDHETGEKYEKIESLNLKDFSDIKDLWNTYLDKQWLPWSEFYIRYLGVQKIYAQLFHIYQEQQKLGEQYELICCIGLLTWRTPNDHTTRRHLIAAKASLEFEPHLGKFTVRPSEDGDTTYIEFDMLDIEDQPQNIRQLTEDGRESLRDNLWDRATVDSFLNAVANSLADRGQGQYHGDHLAPSNITASDIPLVEYAPALILRKRSMRYLENILINIKKQIETGSFVPQEFLDLCESADKENETETLEKGRDDKNKGNYISQLDEIYFPLHANDEQRQIIRTLERQKGVLVQGPPGTGKSHTIANLICHLLASGKRVLITAKTPRALQVLHEKLPEDIKPLCINLLGSGVEERESLEKSVSGILAKIDKWEPIFSHQTIDQLKNELIKNRKDKADTDAKLMALRESETFKHSIANGAYFGTAADIARLIKSKELLFEWFKDNIPSDLEMPLSQNEIDNLCQTLLEFDNETERELNMFIPEPDNDLPKTDELSELFRMESEAESRIAAKTELLDTSEGRALLNANNQDITQLINSLGAFTSCLDNLAKRTMAWIPQATHEVLSDNDTTWRELLKLSEANLNKLSEYPSAIHTLFVCIPDGIDRNKLLHDAQVVLSHFEAGGGEGFWIFKPKKIREHGGFIGKVTVDGIECNNADIMKKLIAFLNVEKTLDYIWSLWSGINERYNAPVPLQIAQIKELNESLRCILDLYELKKNTLVDIGKIKGLDISSWEDSARLHSLIDICFLVLLFYELLAIRKKLDAIHNVLNVLVTRYNSHPINKEILSSFDNRNIDLYCQLVEDVRQLRVKADKVIKKQLAIRKLGQSAPLLAGFLMHCSEPHEWVKRLKDIDNTWAWARAKSWLSDFLNADAASLERHSIRLDEEIRGNLSQLASVHAWNFCFSRMKEDDRRHLMSWQQAMKRYGKGTGKHAHTHRRNAQQHLRECRDSVPSWIMPLHRVYETIKADPGIFDVIIVDEASQCGPEALPLLYLGKRILVVGDDKQISPEAVGINRDQVQRLMRDYLSDFKYADSFDVENSLFAHGRIRFSNRITLREHFRCMPEIIHFSNDLCYRADPLIPLRQYPPERLEPLKTVYVSTGYREGSGQRVINRPEAEALVNVVQQCCNNEIYQGMTMGVIILQGEAQAYLIQDMLLKSIGAEEMQRRRLICGNPYSFQGDERDIVFLSMVAAPNERIGTLTQEADRRRFNVAASRAKDQMWLFHSVTSSHLSDQCFRRRLLEYLLNPKSTISKALGENADELREKAFRANRQIERPPLPFESWFEVDVALAIAGNGFRITPQYEFADKRIDLVIQGTRSQLAVECDGDHWHGVDEYVADLERERKLVRCGWRFFRIRESSYYASPDKALEPLWSLLRNMGIYSVNDEDSYKIDELENKKTAVLDTEDEVQSNYCHEENLVNLDESVENLNGDEPPPSVGTTFQEGPVNIREALRVKPDFLGKTIIEILYSRPNYSCVREHMPTFLLRHWNIVTRGVPRQQFARKVYDVIAVMARKGYITIYKSKNVRIKIGWEQYPGIKMPIEDS